MAGLYIHIPFCRHKCAYCDFFSTPSRSADTSAYLRAVITEWHLRRHELGQNQVTTLYIGGGTPSILPADTLARFMEELGHHIPLHSLREATIEANPEDITPQSISAYRSIGFNRISVGIQSFNPKELESVDRRHSPSASHAALRALQESAINYSADLIYGLPGQTPLQWEQNLKTLLDYRPPHFSAYLLSYEPGTRLYARLQKGLLHEASDTVAQNMFRTLCTTADAMGYNHYEISNLALPGKEARHNSAYWTYTPYLGLGTSAHSFDGTLRRYNPLDIKGYIAAMNDNRTFFDTDCETILNRFNDYIITSLRTSAGFSTAFALTRFGDAPMKQFMSNAAPLLASGMLLRTSTPQGDSRLHIPRDRWLTSDAVFRELILC